MYRSACFTHAHTPTRAATRVRVCTCACTCMCTRVHAQARTGTCTHCAHMHLRTHALGCGHLTQAASGRMPCSHSSPSTHPRPSAGGRVRSRRRRLRRSGRRDAHVVACVPGGPADAPAGAGRARPPPDRALCRPGHGVRGQHSSSICRHAAGHAAAGHVSSLGVGAAHTGRGVCQLFSTAGVTGAGTRPNQGAGGRHRTAVSCAGAQGGARRHSSSGLAGQPGRGTSSASGPC